MGSGDRTFVVLQCCQCNTFQVQSITSADKYRCSVCGYNQPRDRVFARSSKARDCRQVVANYNHQRHVPETENTEPRPNIVNIKSDINWSEYIEEEEDDEDHEPATLLQRTHQVNTQEDQQTRRKRKATDKDLDVFRPPMNRTMDTSSVHAAAPSPYVGPPSFARKVPLDRQAYRESPRSRSLPPRSHDSNVLRSGNAWDDYLDD